MNIRKEEHSLIGKEFFRNPYLLLAISSSILLHLFIIYIPFLQTFFGTTTIEVQDWLLIIIIGSIPIILNEIRTFIAHKVPQLHQIAGYW